MIIPPEGYAILSVFPQPANSHVTLELNVPPESPVRIGLYNLLGIQAAGGIVPGYPAAGVHSLSFPTADLRPGIYLLRVEGACGTLQRPLIVHR
jgi:hypothetical protein